MLAQLSAANPSPGMGLLPFAPAWRAATVSRCWNLLDCLTARRVTGREKTVWNIVLPCANVIGAVLCFLLVRLARAEPPGA